MDTQNPSAPPRAHARLADNKHPNRRVRSGSSDGGLVHDHTRHTTRFTVIGNHLARHPELSLLAIGLATHIQSLPQSARVDIKSLAARFTEGATRIAAALRELETHGYLRRERVRTPAGRIVTRTVSCNQPGRGGHAEAESARHPHPSRPAKKQPRKALPAVPQPAYRSPTLLQTATDLLAELRRTDPRLLLSACDTAHLAPGVAAWLERDLSPTAVRHALAKDLPSEPIHRPAALLAHRLTAQLPPPPPFRAPAAPPAVRVEYPMTNCDGCDRGFRGPKGSRCRDCRPQPHARPNGGHLA
ncbi:helix-turn-helix domain-containing protein [Streptomyces neyagawaensis]|uniref:helix-turn-helix domain-containing protein n=1 Tax=Streptomyces neyagawaensis TaxID=42238 RepID=UPI00201CB0C5|nr:helix-turn-helix domain-containing protein [Streptomyces neyagawaensis]MCL6735614.1 helix-turn-helix domain-containing protein [Streptomyces neyagawaensis]MDE1681269.1 helix-turn-helix domain-containing protein [Streptomyces neyagawaensis]